MTPKRLRIFLDTSVIFAAVRSPTGGVRKIFVLGEAGLLNLVVGPTVLREADTVVRRKAPTSLPILAQLLDAGRVNTSGMPIQEQVDAAREIVQYPPDALVLAEAMSADPDWFITHDKVHFLNEKQEIDLLFQIGTPADLLQTIKVDFSIY